MNTGILFLIILTVATIIVLAILIRYGNKKNDYSKHINIDKKDLLKDVEEYINNMSDEKFIELMKQSEKCPYTIILPKYKINLTKNKYLIYKKDKDY